MRQVDPRPVVRPARALALPALILLLASSSACTLWQREASFFADELTELLEQENEAIEACYDDYLETTDPKASGQLVLGITVEAKTGKLTDLTRAEASDVPEPLAECVTKTIADLTLDPVDVNTGEATITWEFVLGSRKKPPTDPFANVQDAVLGCYGEYLAQTDRDATGTLEVDYAFDREAGRIERLDVVGEGTSVAQPVIECATSVLESAFVDPGKLEDRNAAGRRTFSFAFTPYEAPG